MKVTTERMGSIGLAVAMLVLGLFVGKHTERERIGSGTSNGDDPAKVSLRPVVDGGEPDVSRRSADSGDEEVLRLRTMAALTQGSLREREVGINLVLDGITADNWKPVWREFIRQTIEDGRTQDYEWSRTMRRIGEVSGAEGIEFFDGKEERMAFDSRAAVLVGWASADPKKAFEWIKSQPADGADHGLWGAYIQGVSQGDPMFAIKHRDEIPEALRERAMAIAGDGMVQSGNLRAAVATLRELVSEVPEGDSLHDLQGYYHSLNRRMEHIREVAATFPEFESELPDMSALDAAFRNTQ